MKRRRPPPRAERTAPPTGSQQDLVRALTELEGDRGYFVGPTLPPMSMWSAEVLVSKRHLEQLTEAARIESAEMGRPAVPSRLAATRSLGAGD
jgi:hypothetical protein